MEAREFFALKHDYLPARLREQGCRSAAGRPASNDCDIVLPGTHRVLMIANYPDFGRNSLLDPPALERGAYRFVLTCAPEDEVDRSIC